MCMFIYGFPLSIDDDAWDEDPENSESITPESEICEACHIYYDSDGNRYIGMELTLGLSVDEMNDILSPFSEELHIRRVI